MDAAREDLDAGRVRLLPGSCVVELLPAAAWHKGSALQWIRERIERLHGPTFTVYVGDDVTDEDAFGAVGPDGLTISASEHAAGAEFSLDGPEGVKRLLHSLDGPEDNRRA
jgi:alpha,alpha-trehalase